MRTSLLVAALLVAAFLPVVIGLALRSRYALSRARMRWVVASRALSMICVVLTMTDLRWERPTRELALAAVIDPSSAISEEERTRLSTALAEAQRSHPELRAAAVEGTLAMRISSMAASMPSERIRRLVVATDGFDPRAEVATAIANARALGIHVSVLPIGSEPLYDSIALTDVRTPRLVRAGEETDVAFHLHSVVQQPVELEVTLDGHTLGTARAELSPGENDVTYSIHWPEELGVHELSGRILSGSHASANDRQVVLVLVERKPRVRIYRSIDPHRSSLAQVLRDAGMDVEVASPGEAFSRAADYDPYALVVVDEIDPADFDEAQQHAIRQWVERSGGGLLETVGPHPVRRTPRILREIEPIEPPPALPEPRPLELVIVIDHSGSMSGAAMEQARRAGVAAINALRADSRVGAVAFSSEADRTQPPLPMTQARVVTDFISRLEASGGTNISAAITAANRIMSNDPRFIHHVVLVSDGESDPRAAIAAAMALAGRGVSISTITIGGYSSLLAEIARIGRGRYHATSAAGLTSLVVSEATARQPPAQRSISFTPRPADPLPMLEGLDLERLPQLQGHAQASLREGARMALTATSDMPLLAHWHRGLGQVATWTSSTDGSFSDRFRETSAYRQLFAAIAKGMLRTRTAEPPRIDIRPSPRDASLRWITITSPFPEHSPLPIARIARGRGTPQELELSERGPGVYRAEVPASFAMLIDARLPIDPEVTAAAGNEVPYPPELGHIGVQLEAVERLAKVGEGKVSSIDALFVPAEAAETVREPLREELLWAALVSYLASLLLLRWPDRKIGTGRDRARPSRISVPPRNAQRETSRGKEAA